MTKSITITFPSEDILVEYATTKSYNPVLKGKDGPITNPVSAEEYMTKFYVKDIKSSLLKKKAVDLAKQHTNALSEEVEAINIDCNCE